MKYVDDEQVKHVENFVRHCAIGTYDNNSILRYIPDFILQTGDSTNSGKNSTIADLEHHLGEKMSPEFTKTSPQPLSRGVVYAVNHEETLYGSQFFIVLSDLHKASLENNPSYTVIGAVIDGFEAIAGIEKDDLLEVKKNGKPRGKWKDKIWLEGVRVHNNPFAW